MLSDHKITQWGGAAFMLGSLLFLVNKLDEMSRLFLSRPMADVISGENMLLVLAGQVAFAMGYAAYYWQYARHATRWVKLSLGLFCAGGLVLAVGHVSFIEGVELEAMFILVLIGLLVMLSGLIPFGIMNLRRPVLGRWQWLPLATGLMGFIGFFLFSGEEINAVFLFFRSLFAMGLFGLGMVLWLERPAPVAVVLLQKKANTS